MFIELQVVIRSHLGHFVFGVFIRECRQRFERRLVNLLEQVFTAQAVIGFHRPLVSLVIQQSDGLIECLQRVKDLVAQPR